jgi:hypothetical protein
MIIFSCDLSQVEARVELMLAAATPEFAGTDVAKECIRLATAHPAEFDIHTWSAAVALGKSESEISDKPPPDGSQPSDRQIGKTTMHGFMRGMGAQTMADSLLKSGYVVTPEMCELRLNKLAAKLPAIPDGYFPDIRRQLMRYRGLATTYGAIWRCDWFRLGEELYGKGYSYQPVRETVDLINQEGFLPLMNAINLRKLNPVVGRPTPVVHVHGHDSLTTSVHPEDAWQVASFIERTLGSCERRYAAGVLKVPVTYSLGSTWKSAVEFKRLDNQQKFRDAAYACSERK